MSIPERKFEPEISLDGMEHDACGIGAVVSINGVKDYETLDKALHIVEKLEHRAGKDATGTVGDGVGILSHRISCIKKQLPSLASSLVENVITE